MASFEEIKKQAMQANNQNNNQNTKATTETNPNTHWLDKLLAEKRQSEQADTTLTASQILQKGRERINTVNAPIAPLREMRDRDIQREMQAQSTKPNIDTVSGEDLENIKNDARAEVYSQELQLQPNVNKENDFLKPYKVQQNEKDSTIEEKVESKFLQKIADTYDVSNIVRKIISGKNVYAPNTELSKVGNFLLNADAAEISKDLVDFISDEELNEYFKIAAYNGIYEANKYLNNLHSTLKNRQAVLRSEEYAEYGEEHPILASIASVGSNLASPYEQAGNYFKYFATGGKMDRNEAADITQGLRQGVSNSVDWNLGNWDVFDFIYNAGMSGVDSLTAGFLYGPTGAGISLGLATAGATANDIIDRGGTSDQAFFGGTVAGVLEGLFEKVSLGNLKKMQGTAKEAFSSVLKNTGKVGFKTFVKQLGKDVVKNMGVNASEEALTEIGNIVYDTIANGDISNYSNLVEKYMSDEYGMSEDEARTRALVDLSLQVIEAGASGALMGLAFGTGEVATAYTGAKANAKNNSNNQTQHETFKNNDLVNLSAADEKLDVVQKSINNATGYKAYTEDQRQLKKIGEQFGAKVEFKNLTQITIDENGNKVIDSPEGYYDPNTNTIVLNSDARPEHRSVLFILKHELTHSIELDKDAYTLFAKEVFASEEFKSYMQSKGFETLSAWQDAVIDKYERNGKGFKGDKRAAADKEIVADFVGDVLFGGNNKVTEKLLNGLQPETRNKFIEAVKKIFAKLKQLFSSNAQISEIERLENEFLKVANKVAKMNATEAEQQKTTTEKGNGVEYIAANNVVVDLSDDNELSRRVEGLNKNKRYTAIKKYILSELSEQPITLSDGRKAVIDGGDAQHLSKKAGQRKTVHIAKIKQIVETAQLVAEEKSDKEGKFDYFYYYQANVRYNGDIYPIFLNVGKARNDGTYHIYDVTKKLRDTVHRVNDVGQPVGNALVNGISKYNIPNHPKNVKENVEKVNVEIDEKTSNAAKNEGHSRTTNSGIKRFVLLKAKKDVNGKLNTSIQGAKVVDGKQYLSYNGVFVVELNNPDETIPNNDALNVNALKNGFEKAKENSVDGTYSIDVRELSTIAKNLQKGNSNINIVNVGENYFDIKYVNAVLKAIAEPEISLSNMFKSHQMLVVKGSNGQALISPMNIPNLNNDDINVVYTSQRSEMTNNIQLSLPETVNKNLSATDSAYLEAVEKGDMETAQKMVDEAAKKAGYNYHLYHGTNADFTKFDLRKHGGKNGKGEGYGIYLAANKEISAPYGKRVIDSYTKFNRLAEGREKTITFTELKNIIKTSCELEAQRAVNDEEYDSVNEALKDTWVSNYVYTYDYNGMSKVYTDVANILWEANDNDGDIINEIMTSSGAHYNYDNALDFYDNILTKVTGIDGFHYIWGDKSSGGVENDIYLAFHSNQIKSADPVTYDDDGNVIPLSERFKSDNNDIRYSLPDNASVLEIGDAYKNGEISAEEFENKMSALTGRRKVLSPVEVANLPKEAANTTPQLEEPKKVGSGDEESNLYGSLVTSSIVTKKLKEEIAADTFIKNYGTTTNKRTLNLALEELAEGGAQRVADFENIQPERASAVDVAVGLILLERYQRIGDTVNALKIAETLRQIATASGQTVQIFSVIGRFTPEMMVTYAQKELDKAYKELVEKKTKKWMDKYGAKFELTKEEKEFILNHTVLASQLEDGSRAKAILLAEICTLIQDKIPAEVGDTIRALQRISLLLNVKTNVRNIVGNATMIPTYIATDFFGNLIDKQIAKKTNVRTTGNFKLKGSGTAFKKGMYETYDDFKRGIHTKQEELNRFNNAITAGKNFNENHEKLLAKQLNDIARFCNKLDNYTSFFLELGDRPFFEMWFNNSLNNQIRLNNVELPTPEMLEIAKQEALTRTWQDNNKVTRGVQNFKQSLNMIRIPGTSYGLGDFILKFTKTPANIGKAMVEFSPVGLAIAASKAQSFHNALEKGQFTPQMQKELVKSASNAITGTLIYIMVAVAASLGWLKLSGSGDDDKKVSNYEKYIVGIPPYSMELFGVNVTYDWNQPMGAVLATIADYMEASNDEDDSAWTQDLFKALKTGGAVFTKQSFLDGLYEFFSQEDFVTGIFSALLSEPSAFMPQIFSQIASVTDPYRRTTYDPQDAFKSSLNQVINKIPGLRQMLPAQVNVLGEKSKNIQYLNPWEAFVSPANRYPESSGKVAEEIYKLYKDTDNTSVLPKAVGNYITVEGQRFNFNAQEKADFQTKVGQTSVAILEKVLSSSEYKNLTNEQKIKVVAKVYEYAYDKAKTTLDFNYETIAKMEGGTDILTKEKYNRLTKQAIQFIVDENILTKEQRNCKNDPAKLADLFIAKVKKETGK